MLLLPNCHYKNSHFTNLYKQNIEMHQQAGQYKDI